MDDLKSYLLTLPEFKKAYEELLELALGFWSDSEDLTLVAEFSSPCYDFTGDLICVELDEHYSLVLVDEDCMAIVRDVC